ncbi:hypothetical protein D6C82_07748 [Aureobasidium pullulans]|nr:hypothetical protein D6C82_07748 [Aureobasidium pullulans]
MPISIPCALCGSNLSGGTFHYQKHMTQSHRAGTAPTLPLLFLKPTTVLFTLPPPTAALLLQSKFWIGLLLYNTQLTLSLPAIPLPKLPPLGFRKLQISLSILLLDFSVGGQHAWPPVAVSPCSSSTSSSFDGPCERALAGKLARRITPSLKRKRSDSDYLDERASKTASGFTR